MMMRQFLFVAGALALFVYALALSGDHATACDPSSALPWVRCR